ncbi:hypothetical protein HD554DRAFT_2169478 [Boletus coccyginus]|nr:hypothetical protein HD554DRAFT_2169478 [Boletus coccyginus]
MPYSTRAKNGKKFLIPDLAADRRNWSDYREKLFQAAEVQDLLGLLDGTKTKPNGPWDPWRAAAWMRDDTEAQYMLVTTTPPSIWDQINLTTAHDYYDYLSKIFDKPTSPAPQVAAQVPTTYHGTCQKCGKRSHKARECEGVETQSGNAKIAGRHDKKRRESKREGEKPRGRVDEGAAAASGPGMETTDQSADGVGLATPASSPTASREVDNKTVDMTNLSATCAKPSEPMDASRNPQDQLLEVRAGGKVETADERAEMTGEESSETAVDDVPRAPPDPPPPLTHPADPSARENGPPSVELEGECRVLTSADVERTAAETDVSGASGDVEDAGNMPRKLRNASEREPKRSEQSEEEYSPGRPPDEPSAPDDETVIPGDLQGTQGRARADREARGSETCRKHARLLVKSQLELR